MNLIAHRGNTCGPSEFENSPAHIVSAIKGGFDVEIDVWFSDGSFYLGHNKPTYSVQPDFFCDEMWCHAKNIEALVELKKQGVKHYFWHQTDDYTLTSSGYIWTFPGKALTESSIAVMPELIYPGHLIPDPNIYGICSDYVGDIHEQLGNI